MALLMPVLHRQAPTFALHRRRHSARRRRPTVEQSGAPRVAYGNCFGDYIADRKFAQLYSLLLACAFAAALRRCRLLCIGAGGQWRS